MKILITGSEGFIGSHLVEKLISKGAKINAFVQYNSFNHYGWLDTLTKDKLKKIQIFSGDVRDPNSVTDAVKKSDVIINLAALIGIPYSYKSPKSYIDTNILGIFNILEAAKNFNIKKIIHTSTSEIYGSAKFIPITENHPINTQSPYSASKASADQIAMSYFYSYKLPVTILRPFNTYGPRQSMRAVIPTIICQILNSKKINLGNLKPTRDFSYVSDTVDAFEKAIKSKKTSGEVINIGSNFEVSIEEVLKIIIKISNKKISLNKDLNRVRPLNSEVNRLVCSNLKAKKILKWKPRYAGKKGFKEGIKKTFDWFSQNQNLNYYKFNLYNL